MNPKYKHQKIQAMITWNARALTFIQILEILGKQHTEIGSDKKKLSFDMQLTYPELDIQPTGKCEVWIREINQITHEKLARTKAHHIDTGIPISPTNHATLPQVSDATRACSYTPDGKCVGMLNTELYINLANAFHHARDSGHHNQVMPPLKDLNSDLVGLLSYKKECTSRVP